MVTLYPTADSYVRSRQPTTNFGSYSAFDVDDYLLEIAYIIFDLSGYSSAEISEAYLNIYCTEWHQLSATDMDVKRVTSPWGETTVTWNTKPTTIDVNKVNTRKSWTENTWHSINVTQLLKDILDNANYGFALMGGSIVASFGARESTHAPYLSITIAPPTEFITCTANVSNFDVYLDNVLVGNPGDASLFIIENVPVGTHEVQLAKYGYTPCIQTVEVVPVTGGSVHCDLVEVQVPGFNINVDILGLPSGQNLYINEVIKQPLVDWWYVKPLVGIPPSLAGIKWDNISNRLYKARQSSGSCDPTPTEFWQLRSGQYYGIGVSDIGFNYYHSDDVYKVEDIITDIDITQLRILPGWLITLCGYFDVSAIDCLSSFYAVLPDIVFSAEDLSIIIEGKSIYPPYEAKVPTFWNYAFVGMTFIPGSGLVKGAGKAGAKAVKGSKLYPIIVQAFIKDARWTSARFPEKQIGFLETMWDLQGQHLDEVVAQLELGNVDEAGRLIELYLPLGKSPDLCVKDLKTFTANLFAKLPYGMPEQLIKEAGLENSFTINLGKVIYAPTKPTIDSLNNIDEIFTTFPKAKSLIIDDADAILKNTESTSEQMTRIINSVENYPPIIEDLGTKTPLAEVDDLIENAVNKVGYENTPKLTKTLFQRSLTKALESLVPITFTQPQTNAILNIIKKDPIGFSNAIAEFDIPFRVKYIESLKLSGAEGINAINHSEGVIDASRYATDFEAFGYDLDEVAKAFTDYHTTMPEFWAKLGIDSIELASDGKILDSTPAHVTNLLAELTENKISREAAQSLVKSRLLADSVAQIIARGTITSDEIKSLSDLYNQYPAQADEAIKLLTATQLANISTLLNQTVAGRIVESLWGFKDGLRQLIDPDIADDVLEFWIKTNGEIFASSRSLRQFILSNWKIALPIGVTIVSLPLFYLVFEASMIKKLGYEYGFLPTPIYDRVDAVTDLTFSAKSILKQDPSSEAGFRMAKEIIAEMNYLINYVEQNPIPEDPEALEIARTYWGAGIGSLNAETLAHFKLARDLFIIEIEAITGKTLADTFLPEEISAEVTQIIDGDTIKIEYASIEYDVRFLGCNTPESKTYDSYSCIPGTHPFLVRRLAVVGGSCGDEEIWHTNQQNYDETVAWIGRSENLPARAFATFKSDLDDQFDGYGRFLAVPFNAAGENISSKSLREGQSAVFFYSINKQVNTPGFSAAENMAKNENIGIWPFKTEKGWIKFRSDPTATEVYLDGIYIGNTVSNVLLWETNIGIHEYIFKKVGYNDCSGTTPEVTIAHTELNPLELPICSLEKIIPCPTPNASFTQTTTSPDVGELVTFDGTASTPGTGQAIASYEWDFKDGTTATGPAAAHAFTTPGTYIVELKVTNFCGESNIETQIITVTAILDTGELTVKTYSAPGVLLSSVVVYLDNIDKGYAPITIKNLPIGSHSVRLEKSGYLGCAYCEGVACSPGATISPCDFNVIIEKNVTKVLEVTMQKVFPVEIISDPVGATIKVDGVAVTTALGRVRIGGKNLIEQIMEGAIITQKDDNDLFLKKLKSLK